MASRFRSKWMLVAALLAVFVVAFAESCSSSPPTPLDPKSQLEQDTGVSWVVQRHPKFGTPTYVQPIGLPAPILVNGKTADAAAMEFFVKYAALFSMTDPKRELALDRVVAMDSQGLTHAVFKQVAGPVGVYGGHLTMHFDVAGRISFISGIYVPKLQGVSTSPSVDPAAAIATAHADMLGRLPAGSEQYADPSDPPTLTLDAWNDGPPVLRYDLFVSFRVPETLPAPPPGFTGPPLLSRFVMRYEVDARTGAILDASDIRQTAAASGKGVLNDLKSFEVTSFPGAPPFYAMSAAPTSLDAPLQVRCSTLIAGLCDPTNALAFMSNNLNSWDTFGPESGAGVDAYYYLGQVDQYWRTVHGRSSYDNAGTLIKAIVSDPKCWPANTCPFAGTPPVQTSPWFDNAWWSSTDKTFHFAPHQTELPNSVALDVVGHEFQHAVTQFTLGLKYQDESGALNESLSDAFGELIESHYRGTANIDRFGEDTADANDIRNLSDPSLSTPNAQPDYYLTAPYYVGTDDHGGVHTNSGVPNNAWYLATVGGTNKTSGISVDPGNALGVVASEKLYYAVITSLGPSPNLTFVDFARALVQTSGGLPAVGCAWYAVGVLTANELKSSWNITTCDGADGGTRDASTDANDAGDAGDAASDASDGGDGGSCCAASDFEGMTVTVQGVNGEFATSTMTLTKVTSVASVAVWQSNHPNEAGTMSSTLPVNATVFTFMDSAQPAGVVGFPSVFGASNFANRYGRSNLIAVWQDMNKQWQWVMNISGGSYANNGGFPQWHEYQFIYDSRSSANPHNRYDVYLGANGQGTGFTFNRTAKTQVAVSPIPSALNPFQP